MLDTKQIIDAEFRGFFYADGCAQIVRYSRTSYYKGIQKRFDTFRVQLSIVQRDDNLKYLEQIKEMYGGSIYKNNVVKSNYQNSKPRKTWVCTNIKICNDICDILLNTKFIYRNYDAVKSCSEYCKFKLKSLLNAKHKEGDKEYYETLRQRVFKAHQYQE